MIPSSKKALRVLAPAKTDPEAAQAVTALARAERELSDDRTALDGCLANELAPRKRAWAARVQRREMRVRAAREALRRVDFRLAADRARAAADEQLHAAVSALSAAEDRARDRAGTAAQLQAQLAALERDAGGADQPADRAAAAARLDACTAAGDQEGAARAADEIAAIESRSGEAAARRRPLELRLAALRAQAQQARRDAAASQADGAEARAALADARFERQALARDEVVFAAVNAEIDLRAVPRDRGLGLGQRVGWVLHTLGASKLLLRELGRTANDPLLFSAGDLDFIAASLKPFDDEAFFARDPNAESAVWPPAVAFVVEEQAHAA